MKAEWLENTDERMCLCCGQVILLQPSKPMTPERMERALQIFTALGLTREDLLGKHRAQLDYQAPGMAAWLQGQ
jgi:hypothetical protein